VSLSEDPVNEIPVCYEILQALGLRKTQVEYIACPSCGRTKFDLPTVLREVRNATRHLVGLDIAVMGCIVNGPGEMADADYVWLRWGGGRKDHPLPKARAGETRNSAGKWRGRAGRFVERRWRLART